MSVILFLATLKILKDSAVKFIQNELEYITNLINVNLIYITTNRGLLFETKKLFEALNTVLNKAYLRLFEALNTVLISFLAPIY